VHGRAARPNRKRGSGYAFLHTALDDHSRLAYSEILTDERKETAAAFWTRAHAYFTSCGISVKRVLTDNGNCYRSFDFRNALGDVVHKRTRPYRPQTNGKVERFWRTLDEDVIEGTTFDNLDRFANELFEYLVYYNNHRPHQALAGQTPKAFAATKANPTRSAN